MFTLHSRVARSWQRLLVGGLLIGALLVPMPAHAQAASPETAIAPSTATNVLGDLSANWWTYVIAHLGTFTTVDCVNTGTGVTFLFGSMDNQPTSRDCQVKDGTQLFFPLATQVFINTPPPAGNGKDKDLQQCVADLATPATDLHLSLDGVSVPQSALFALVAPSPTFSVDGAPFGFPGQSFAAAADGYWVLLPVLAPGEHTLKFGGTVAAQSSRIKNCGPVAPNIQDITYRLNVSR